MIKVEMPLDEFEKKIEEARKAGYDSGYAKATINIGDGLLNETYNFHRGPEWRNLTPSLTKVINFIHKYREQKPNGETT